MTQLAARPLPSGPRACCAVHCKLCGAQGPAVYAFDPFADLTHAARQAALSDGYRAVALPARAGRPDPTDAWVCGACRAALR